MSEKPTTCPHCGVAITDAQDAFCPECRCSLDETPLPAGMTQAEAFLDRATPPPGQGDGCLFVAFNRLGLLYFVESSLSVVAVEWVLRDDRYGLKLVTFGSFAALLDLRYRLFNPAGRLLEPSRGGKAFFLPLWIPGLAWIVAGIYQLVIA